MSAYTSRQSDDGFKLKRHDNGVIYIHWTEKRRSKRESTGQKEDAAAQIYLGEWLKGVAEAQLDNGQVLTIAELWDFYFARHVEKNNVDSRAAETRWKNLRPHFGALKLAHVERLNADGADKVDEYIALRKAGKIGSCPAAPATIRHELAILKACFNWCAKPKQKIIKASDVPAFDLPENSESRDRWLRMDETQKLLTAAAELRDGSRLSIGERFLWLALETATRLQAAIDLTWDRVDFETGVIHYKVPGQRQTKKRRASVPISKALRPILLRAHAERENEFVLGGPTRNIWRTIKIVAKRAGVADVSPHVLRHTAATHMARRGVSLWVIAGVLANTIEMVEKTYAHHCPEGLAGGVELISGGMLEPAE